MPNWCYNTLTITSDEKQLKQLKQKAKRKESKNLEKSDFSLNKLYPTPKDASWYDWNIKNWGTKWDITAYIFSPTKNKLNYSFDSAWLPPDNAIIHISKQYPKLNFTLKYEESGCAFAGILKVKNGIVEKNEIWNTYYCQECGDNINSEEETCTECQKDNPNQLFAEPYN